MHTFTLFLEKKGEIWNPSTFFEKERWKIAFTLFKKVNVEINHIGILSLPETYLFKTADNDADLI